MRRKGEPVRPWSPGATGSPGVEHEEPANDANGGPNPYLAARRTWNDHVGRLVAARSLWQVVALLSLLIALAAVGGLIHLAGQTRFVPYVVEVDRLGHTYAVGQADRAAPADRRVIEAQLAEFVTMARRVTPDVALQRQAIYRVYAMLSPGDPATSKMNAYLNGSEAQNPFNRARHETVTTEVSSVLQQTEETWQVQWRESVYDLKGNLQGKPRPMRALLTIYQANAKVSEETLQQNPLGIYVRDFNWVRERTAEEQP